LKAAKRVLRDLRIIPAISAAISGVSDVVQSSPQGSWLRHAHGVNAGSLEKEFAGTIWRAVVRAMVEAHFAHAVLEENTSRIQGKGE